MARVDVKFALSSGATSGYIKIDRKGVKLVNGVGQADVDDTKPYHTVTMWFDGASGGTLEYGITQDLQTLVKGKVTISFGQAEGVVTGRFKLKDAA